MRTLILVLAALLGAAPLAAATVDGDAVLATARAAALSALDGEEGLVLAPLAPPAALEIVGDRWRLVADAPRLVAGGRVAVVVRAQDGPRALGERTVWFRATRDVEAAIATRALAAHAVVRPQDLRYARQALPLGVTSPVLRATPLDGLRLRAAVRAGTPLVLELFEAVPAVDARQRVKVHAVAGPVAIEARGTARAAGAVGERIEVMVDGASAPVSGRIVATAEVIVDD